VPTALIFFVSPEQIRRTEPPTVDQMSVVLAQRKTLRTTNVIKRLNEELRRGVKTQGALPIEARKLDGYKQLAAVIR